MARRDWLEAKGIERVLVIEAQTSAMQGGYGSLRRTVKAGLAFDDLGGA